MSNSHFLHQSVHSMKIALESSPQYMSLIDVLDDLDDIANELNQAAVQMDGLAKALSNFAQADADRDKAVEMLSKLETALLLLEYPLIKYGIEVKRHAAHHTLLVRAPASQLVQLFMNILMGSIVAIKARHTHDFHGTIHISAYIDGESGVIKVTHNGSSEPYRHFTDRVLQRRELLQRLQRAAIEENLLQEAAVSGKSSFHDQLGLTIANEIVRRHNGTLKVSDAAVKTKTVTLTIKFPLIKNIENANV